MKQHPAFKFIFAAVFVGIFIAVHGCITVRQSGAHDTNIYITQSGASDSASLSMVAHRENSAQDAKSDPNLTPVGIGDEALKTAGKTVVGAASGGLSTIPQAAAKVAEEKKP